MNTGSTINELFSAVARAEQKVQHQDATTIGEGREATLQGSSSDRAVPRVAGIRSLETPGVEGREGKVDVQGEACSPDLPAPERCADGKCRKCEACREAFDREWKEKYAAVCDREMTLGRVGL